MDAPGYPKGFGPYSARGQFFTDDLTARRSLQADGDDMSGLAEVGPNDVWKLSIRYRKVDDASFDYVTRLDGLEELDLTGTKISDAALRGMHTMQRLKWLDLSRCAITSAGLQHVASLRRLEHLNLFRTRVTKLDSLAHHPNLRTVNVRDTAVTGEALAALTTLPELRQLSLDRKQYRHADAFAAARPEVEILS